MATFHYVHLRTFAHETEDPEKVKTALRNAVQGADIAWTETRADGGNGNRILILDGEVKSAPAAKRLFGALAQDDPQGFARLLEETERRVDENLNYHLRLDKQEAYLGRVILAHNEDAITVRAKIRSFKSKRSGEQDRDAMAELTQFLHGVAARSGS